MARRVLFINERSGGGGTPVEELVEAARARGVEPRVLGPGDDVHELALAADAEALGVAGGDGSLAPVATAAVLRDLPFVCVPTGTRNHFARDVGFDRDSPLDALEAFDGAERRIDVGRVGDRLFLNNVSFGVYARLVHRRETHRRRRNVLARLRALALVARRRHPLPLSVDGRPLNAHVVLVANNDYDLQLLSLGERPRLDEGRLHLYAATGWLPGNWVEDAAESFRLDSPHETLRAAIDGEPVTLETPIELRIQPLALRVLLPPG